MHTVGMLVGMSFAALAAPATGPLRVSDTNPRYFEDPTGKAVYLAGSHDGWELQDYAWGDANPGREYLVYVPDGGDVTVDLSKANGALALEWFNPRTGDRMKGGPVEGGAKRELKAPFEGCAVLYIAAREGNR